MSKVRRVIGHVSVEKAVGQRACRRNRNHRIALGEQCLVIKDHGTPIRKSYCSVCALEILKQCAADLRLIRDRMYGSEWDGTQVEKVKTTKVEQLTIGEQLVESNQRSRSATKNEMEVTDYQANPTNEVEDFVQNPENVVPLFSRAARFYSTE